MQETIKYTDRRTKTELIKFETEPKKANIEIIEGKKFTEEITQQKNPTQILEGDDKIEQYNKKNWQNGIKIKIPKNTNQTIKINTTGKNFTAHRKQITLEENSTATIIDTTKGEITTNSETTEITLQKNSTLNYIKIQELELNTINFTIKKSTLEENSTLNQTNILLGAKTNIERTETKLEGEKSKTTITDILFGEKNQHYDLATIVEHTKGNTNSTINGKIALKNQSRCVYRPLIKIKPNATNSNGQQQGKILMLSEDAKADPIPKLDIENNEVQCTHGIGITQIDEEKLFYLQTRGIEPQEAKKQIIKGFFKTKINHKETEKKLEKEIEKKLDLNR